MNPDKNWHVEKGIPIATIVAVIIQTATIVWWASGMSSRVEILERQVAASGWQAERIIRLDERITSVQTGIAELKTLVISQPLKNRNEK